MDTLPSFFQISCFYTFQFGGWRCACLYLWLEIACCFLYPEKGTAKSRPPSSLPPLAVEISIPSCITRKHRSFYLLAHRGVPLSSVSTLPLAVSTIVTANIDFFKQIVMKGLHFTHICCGLSFTIEYRSKPSYSKACILQVKKTIFRKGYLT